MKYIAHMIADRITQNSVFLILLITALQMKKYGNEANIFNFKLLSGNFNLVIFLQSAYNVAVTSNSDIRTTNDVPTSRSLGTNNTFNVIPTNAPNKEMYASSLSFFMDIKI
ncbi:hypothetical protein GCM10028819_36860 [Spirosoma humi]